MNSHSRISSMTLAAMFTLAMLMGVNALAGAQQPAPQVAQAATCTV